MASNEFFANLGEKLKDSGVQRVIAGVAVLLAVVIGGGVYMTMNKVSGKSKISPVANAVHSAPAAAAAVPVAEAPVPAAPVNTSKSNDGASPVKLAAGEGANAPVVTSVAPSNSRGTAQMAHLDDHLTYQYNALGRRDPFQSLINGGFVGVDMGGDAPPDPGGIKVVGIVWGSTDQFALVEDVRGNSLVLRKGDKVQNGYVEALKRDAIVVSLTAEGQTQSVVIPLIRKGDQNAR